MKIGITGHQKLENPNNWNWVKLEFNKILAQYPKPFTGVTSLAIGADQLFAEAVLEHGGSLTAIIPFNGYEFKFSEGDDRQKYHYLLDKSTIVNILPRMTSDEESYFEAGKTVVDMIDFLVAVWDGKSSRGLGGTADIVKYAQQSHKKIVHLNPILCTVVQLD
ncbi:hypothetical protein LC613_42990 [Nostoc sphaeroides CHAB 2801]|uniref:hypothetical protein n=1 Tax=Nostoc sphaeroides TaxID=446679 RepID=UPI001E5B4393|nr:hypothetical protein [Nostoc sphaeroides]MCC5634170.1 hypothetical protein [Nostoc sphaeroides CHAB 2801]